MSITVDEFLRRKGAIGLLSLLHERPMTYSEIEPEIEVTSSTIVERRDDAAGLGLIDVSLGQGEIGTKKVYTLTDLGEYLTEQMAREGIISNYRKMRALQQLLDDQTDSLVTWVHENPSQLLQFDEAIDGTIIKEDELTEDSGDDSETEEESSSSSSDREHPSAADQYPSNMDDAEIDPPERPSDRDNSQVEDESPVDTGSSDASGVEASDGDTEGEMETSADESSSESVPPSERPSAFDDTPDPEDLKQETFEEMARNQESNEEENEDTETDS